MGRIKAAKSPRGRSGVELQVDHNGEAVFTLPEDDYVFLVDASSLPIGLIPAPLQRRADSSFMDGFAARRARVKDGSHSRVEILVHAAGRVQGYVRDQDQGPMEGVLVRASSIRLSEPQVTKSVRTDESGYYEMYLKPSDYRLGALVMDKTHSLYRKTKPAPVDVLVEAREEINLDFVFGTGTCDLSGIVMDPAILVGEEDVYWPDALVVVHTFREVSETPDGIKPLKLADSVAWTRTDANGHWLIEDLLPGHYQVDFDPYEGYYPADPDSKFACWIPRLYVDLETPGEHDTGAWIAPRSRPCDVYGRVAFSQPFSGHLDVEVVYPRRHEDPREAYAKSVRVNSDGTFYAFVHTLPDPIPAQLRLRRRGEPDWEVVQDFDPVPNGTRYLEIEYP